MARFEPRAAALLLEEEIREAVIGTAGAALGALLPIHILVTNPGTVGAVLGVLPM